MKRTKLKRKKPLKARTSLKAKVKKWVKKVLKRDKQEEQFGPPGFSDFIRGSGCVVARATGTTEGCLGPIQHCHRASRGAGGGWRGNSFGACLGHHHEQHQLGIKTFQRIYRLNLEAECERLTFQWERR